MKLQDSELKKILLAESYVTEDDLQAADDYALANNCSIKDYLLKEGLLSSELFGQAMAEHFGVAYVNLKKEKIDKELLKLIPESVANSQGVIAFFANEEKIKLAMLNPSDIETIRNIEKMSGKTVEAYYSYESEFEEALKQYKAGLQEKFKQVLKKLMDSKMTREQRDDVTVEMVDIMLQYGYDNKSSDIHIEPYEKKLVVRFRIDGVLHNVLEMPKELSEYVLSRIKIISKMRTDEHRAAQDGKLRFQSGEEMIDVRVSVVPSVQGETVVMRLLSSKNRQYSLTDLGLAGNDLKKVKKAIAHPHGMILVTGPTGSGKTTSLYAVLKILNKEDVNIATIEDPVEYDIGGITQIQVNTKTNLTFAKGLRAIVRQDPDIIMVGEIRDEETAGIAVNSALTGHLVLSTLHTNDAATALPRLLDMGVEPCLVSSTVNVIIAQRLVRSICSKCKMSYKLTAEEETVMKSEKSLAGLLKKKGENLFYKGKGCKSCSDTGYSGRIGIFEVIEMDESMKKLVVKQASSSELVELAKKNGMRTMMEDGVEKAVQGLTTIEEVLRVTRE